LKSMSIQGTFLPWGLASSLNLPSLRTLSVICHSPTPQNEEESGFVDWVQNFGDALTEVSFEHSALTPSAFIYCLERLPNVVTLRMMDSGMVIHGDWAPGAADSRAAIVSDSVLARLTPQSDPNNPAGGSGQCLCPHLQNLSCRMRDRVHREGAFGLHSRAKAM
jgi:hypothetical protein